MIHTRKSSEEQDPSAQELAAIAQFERVLGVPVLKAATDDYAWQDIWRLCIAAHKALEQADRGTLDACIKVLRMASLDTLRYQQILQCSTPATLHKRFGNFASSNPMIETDTVLEQTHVSALLAHEVNLIRVRSYAEPDLCTTLADALDALPTTVWTYGDDKARTSTDVFTVGVPAQTATSENSRRKYREQEFEIVRRLSHPSLSPLDRFRLDLDALSPHGATVHGGSDGRRRLAGIVRIYKPERSAETATDGQAVSGRGAEGYLHIDCLQEKEARMYSCNIYLDTPKEGGELTLYNIVPPLFDGHRPLRMFFEFFRNFAAFEGMLASLHSMNTAQASVHADLAKVLPPPITVRPDPGDLILINPGVPHAVRDLPVGRRVSIQGFLKVRPDRLIRFVA